MSKRIGATEANRQFSELLRRVGEGETFVITSHGKSVAEMRPPSTVSPERLAARKRLFERLKSQPAVNAGKWTRDELYED